jgi:hypothetical protein
MHGGLKAKAGPLKALWCAAFWLAASCTSNWVTVRPFRKRHFGISGIFAMNNQGFAPRDRE